MNTVIVGSIFKFMISYNKPPVGAAPNASSFLT